MATGREHDLTPTPGDSHKGGGGDSLYRFIKEELIPFVEKNYRTYNYRLLGGVSYGGLFVMNAFVNDPLYFNGYLSLSPSMWWDNNIILNKTSALLSKTPEFPTRLYLTMANEGLSMGVDSLDALLKKYAPKNFAWKFDKHPDEVHNTIHFKGIWDGIKFLLADWHYPFIDFGTKEKPFTASGATGSASAAPKVVKLPSATITGYSGLYQDSFGRLLLLTKTDNALQLSCDQLPGLTLYPETTNRFFLSANAALEKLHLNNVQVQFEFAQNDSLMITTNGKNRVYGKKANACSACNVTRRSVTTVCGNLYLVDTQEQFPNCEEGAYIDALRRHHPFHVVYDERQQTLCFCQRHGIGAGVRKRHFYQHHQNKCHQRRQSDDGSKKDELKMHIGMLCFATLPVITETSYILHS